MTKPLERGWKVIRWDRISVLMLGTCAVHYKRNRRTFPSKGNGPLAVFTSEEAAKRFTWTKLDANKSDLVVSCKYKPNIGNSQSLWYIGPLGGTRWAKLLKDCPEGTALAEFVICLE